MYVLVVLFFIASFLDFKRSVQVYIFIRLFLPSSLSLINVPNLPLISFERVLIFILILMYLKYLVEKPRKKRELSHFPYKKAFLLLTTGLIIITVNTTMPLKSSVFNLVSILIEYFVIMIIVWSVFDNKNEIMFVFKGLFFVYSIIMVYGILTKIYNYNPYIEYIQENYSSHSRQLLYSYDDISRGGIYGRIQSTFLHPITYGGHIVIIFPYIITFYMFSRFVKRFYYLLLIILSAVSLIFINSRSPIIFISIILIGMFILNKGTFWVRFAFVTTLVFVLVISLRSYFQGYYDTLINSIFFWRTNTALGGSTLYNRQIQLLTAFSYFMKSPITGFGLTKTREIVVFGMEKNFYGGESFLYELLIDQGIIGIICWGFMFYVLYHSFQRMTKIVKDNFSKVLLHQTMFMIIGYVVFILVTGELQTLTTFLIIIALIAKYMFFIIKNLDKNTAAV